MKTSRNRFLTAHEYDVLLMVARTGSNRDAAHRLGLAEQTIKNELSLIYTKLGVKSAAQAVYTVLTAE